MPKIIITAESGSDITKEQALQYGIEIVPMHVTMGDKTLDDGSFPVSDICDFYDKNGTLPKTSASTTYDFEVVFDRVHQAHPDAQILHMAYSAVTTASYQCAKLAAEGRDYVTLVDTKQVSVGQAASVILMAEFLQKHPETPIEEAAAEALRISNSIQMCFVPANLEYLRAGGRCSNLVFLTGQLLKLHPNVEIKGGKLLAAKKYRGSFTKVIPKLIEDWTRDKQLLKERLWLIRTHGLSQEFQNLAQKTAENLGYRQIKWMDTGCVITTHGGPGAFGVVGICAT